MDKIQIRPAAAADAPLISQAVIAAIGDEIARGIAGENATTDDVGGIFTRLAMGENSQYSWRNARIACGEDNNAMGVCISYDGADLKKLRRSFFHEANRVLGWNMTPEDIESLPGETSEDEYYLDTLMTLPQYRKKGVATALITDAMRKAANAGKPLGLLCETNNSTASALYESLGFKKHNRRPFAGVMMNHYLYYGVNAGQVSRK